MPAGSRGAVESYSFLRDGLTDAARNALVVKLEPVARELDCTLAQLALAWCLKNPHVSSVITGATHVEQLRENLHAAEVAARLTDDLRARIEAITAPGAV